jgi:hypothetical protein
VSFTSWISPDEEALLEQLAQQRARHLDKTQRKVDVLHWLLELPIVKRYAETGRWK